MTNIKTSGNKEGLYRLCAAVIQKAHGDYITGTPNELYYLRQFIHGPLFKIYSLGVDADPDTVIESWERDRSEYRAKRLRICNRVDHTST